MGIFSNKKKNTELQDKNETSIQPEKEEQELNTEDEELEEKDIFEQTGVIEREERDINELIDELIDYFTQVDPIKLNLLERGSIKKESFINDVNAYISSKITRDEKLHKEVYKGFASFIWSYDILDDLISDEEISDIKVYNENLIRVKRLGKRETSPLKFRNEKHFSKFVEHVAIKNKVSISDQNAAQNFVDKESSPVAILRFNITTGFINSSGKPVLHIRKIPKTKYTTDKLISLNMMDKERADYLIDKAKNAGGILFCGKGASGKTTAMNWLIDFIPEDRSGLVIQENEELFSTHPDMAFQHTVINRGEGKIEYTLQDLARNGLLMDLDYFIIGEIKGEEAVYLLNAVYTGHRGWASVHGASSTEAMNKLVDYIKYNSDYTQSEALQMLTHLEVVVFMQDFKVAEVSEVLGYDEDTGKLKYKKVF